ncbi:MAG TPA: cytochrome d ubiquinol oxidase subunit II [Candidatus Limnocylindrales bacterium]|nr:cytochrome d ubiquinol oxidase subunit II [Candidatus Limnocylindrales bacterium]
MTLVDVTAVVLWLGVTTYAVFGGADFGAGFWDLVSGRGDQGERSRGLIATAIGPVWEANHTWLIFDLVILWTAFPVAFAAIMSSLFVPLSLAAVGIVLRGAAFAFRPVVGSAAGRRVTTAIFAASSVMTPFFLGAAGGGIASGRVTLDPTGGDLVGSWLNPTSVLVGLMAVAACAYLAAVFLVADARRLGQADLAALFLRRARVAAVVTGGLAVVGILVLAADAPVLADELIRRGWPLVIASSLLGGAALVAIGQRAPFGTRPLAVGAVVAIIWGWGVAQYPDILPRTLSLADAAAPSGSLGSLLVVFVAAALLIAPSLVLLFWLAQDNRLPGHVPEAVADPAARVD